MWQVVCKGVLAPTFFTLIYLVKTRVIDVSFLHLSLKICCLFVVFDSRNSQNYIPLSLDFLTHPGQIGSG